MSNPRTGQSRTKQSEAVVLSSRNRPVPEIWEWWNRLFWRDWEKYVKNFKQHNQKKSKKKVKKTIWLGKIKMFKRKLYHQRKKDLFLRLSAQALTCCEWRAAAPGLRLPRARNHGFDPASVFLSTHWWSQHPACQRCFYKPWRNCPASQRVSTSPGACGKRPEPPRATRSQPEFIKIFFDQKIFFSRRSDMRLDVRFWMSNFDVRFRGSKPETPSLSF